MELTAAVAEGEASIQFKWKFASVMGFLRNKTLDPRFEIFEPLLKLYILRCYILLDPITGVK